ncbi:hypothetical protein DFS34DRAFT_223223 [Phlyctochytrium arcticum]|nr:hypothetical protein DFS34DRAFT_223223 [Phlyctochytrium arcticum]
MSFVICFSLWRYVRPRSIAILCRDAVFVGPAIATCSTTKSSLPLMCLKLCSPLPVLHCHLRRRLLSSAQL